jgi:translation initiation factor 3 subunit B
MAPNSADADDLADEAASLDGYFSDAPLEPQPKYPPIDSSFDRCVVITGLPKVPEAKCEKLSKVVIKLINRIGNLASYEGSDDYTGFYMPTADDGNTVGCAFVEFQSAGDAKKAIEVLQDYNFDKNHSIKVTMYERASHLAEVEEDEFRQPEPEPYKERPNTMSWLEDPSQRDQFAIRHGKETAVYWNYGRGDPVLDYDGAREKKAGVNWCDHYVQWSPKGSYFVTLVPSKGVVLWGGKNFEKLGRFSAPGVEFVLFSPQENYLLTNNMNKRDPQAIKIFSVQSGNLLRAFSLYPKDFLDPEKADQEGGIPPPPFQWSHDDKYLARMGKDLISVFETPSMKLLDKRSLATDGIHEFQFSPKSNIIAYWAPEHKNQPAHVDLVELPSRKQLRQKNLFNVNKCSMVWQEDGHYLGVKVTRHTKSKKTLYNNLELFRVNEPGVPVEMLDVKDAVMSFAWEPQGSRFAIIHAENPTSTKVNVTFYDMFKTIELEKKKGNKKGSGKEKQIVAEVNLVETLEGKQCNCIFWSPAGRTVILAALGDSASGTLEFYDVDSKTLVIKEHYRANQVLWDPSGRTVATTVSQPIGGGHFKFAMDNGYIIWTFQGKQLSQASFEAFYQFQWRPREKLATKEEIVEIAKNIKKYEKQFNAFDEAKKRKLRLQETKGKRKNRAEFRSTLARLKEWRARQKQDRMALLGGYDSEDEKNFTTKEITIETVLNTKEELVY